MNFNDYQQMSRKTAKYPDKDDDFTYVALGLLGEAGEVSDKLKKHMRDDSIFKPSQMSKEQKQELGKELGDVLWYLTQLATEMNLELDTIAQGNIDKLYSRLDRGTLQGSGDNR